MEKSIRTEGTISWITRSKSTPKSKYRQSYLSDISSKDAEWDRWRLNSQKTHDMLKQGEESEILGYAERMQQCAQSLLFALNANSLGEVKHRLKNVYFCRLRHCSVCQARRSRRNYINFLKKLPKILVTNPNVRWVFLTLTVPNVPIARLREELKKMSKAWNRFNKLKEFENVLAWIKSVEVTKEKKRDSYAHPHFHILLMVKSIYFKSKDDYVNREQWRDAWRKSMRDNSIVAVDVRIADRYKGNRLKGHDLVASVSELLKYSVKPSDMLQSRAWLVELIRQVRNMRFLSSGGLLKSVFAEKLTNEEMIHTGEDEVLDEVEVGELRYWWRPLEGRYSRRVKIEIDNQS